MLDVNLFLIIGNIGILKKFWRKGEVNLVYFIVLKCRKVCGMSFVGNYLYGKISIYM